MDSPCLTCTRVKDPKHCENKLCGKWRTWFLYEWKRMQSSIIEYVQKEKSNG